MKPFSQIAAVISLGLALFYGGLELPSYL